MQLKRILFLIGLATIFTSFSFAQTSPGPAFNDQAFKQQLQQVRDQIKQAIQSGNQALVQQLKAQENALIFQGMQAIHARKIAWAKAHPPAPSNDPNVQWANAQMQLKIQMQDAIDSGDTKTAQQIQSQLAANAGERFAQIRANKQAWLQAHPAEAARRSREEQFRQSQLPLFFQLGAAIHSGDTQTAAQIRAQLAAARKQWIQSGGQIPPTTPTLPPTPTTTTATTTVPTTTPTTATGK